MFWGPRRETTKTYAARLVKGFALVSDCFLAPDCVQHIPTWQPILLPAEAGFPVKRGHLRGVYADPTGTLKNMVIHCISALMGHDVKGGDSWRFEVGPLRCWKLEVVNN